MAISNAIKDAGAAPAPAAAPAPTPKAKAQGKSGTSDRTEAFKATGEKVRQMMTEDQKAMEGSKSDTVEFICALGDPARKQNRVEARSTSLDSYVVVGYKFKVLEDCTVPHAPIVPDFKTPLDVAPISERPVKAGEIVSLNIVETAAFISRTEYAGRFTGGEIGVFISAKISQSRQEPLPVLNKIGKGSVKENMELIADMVGGDGTIKGGAVPKIKDEYAEMFSVLYRKKSLGGKSTGSAKKPGESQANIAAAFRQLYASKKA